MICLSDRRNFFRFRVTKLEHSQRYLCKTRIQFGKENEDPQVRRKNTLREREDKVTVDQKERHVSEEQNQFHSQEVGYEALGSC